MNIKKSNKNKERKIMTTDNITSATIIIELDNGEYAVTSTANRAVIDLCSALLEFKRIPKEMVQEINISEINNKEDK